MQIQRVLKNINYKFNCSETFQLIFDKCNFINLLLHLSGIN